ncbi:acyl-CoA thioesterase [Duganella sp. LX20W]|uniref:Acyl-CoA thioesterase n=1 Tax=Rugamonas brunnea TaxID=2758569 RepID=A0A7W2ICT5_9BURK|nr:thioesterase family protein [Rugamonas brunnea]MBA5638593.1 acyl-CoA thioesterase [Rugamonas brunnea]
MPDIQLLWDRPHPFILPVSPQAADIDGLDHTNNAVYVRWCEAAGWAHSNALGLTLADYKRLDRGMAIRRSEFDYIFATNAGEQLLLGTWLLAGENPLSMKRCFQLIRQSDGNTVLRASWHLVCIELSSGRPKRVPPEFSAVYGPAFSE